MCSVTYLPLPNNNFILTTNRDISIHRKPATFPAVATTKNGKILFPKDGKAGGTWIGISEFSRAVVLLNGGFENHLPKPSYAKSRGIIVQEILKTANAWVYLQEVVLTNIEPFTLLIMDWQIEFQLWEFVWDGERKYLKELDKNKPTIYSSSTLYDTPMRQKRESWFNDWLPKNPTYEQADILDFHESAGEGNPHESLFLNRGYMQTVSITSIQKRGNLATVLYHDTVVDSFNYQYFEFNNKKKLALI
jgi:uncharacterized protein with NRDE domain